MKNQVDHRLNILLIFILSSVVFTNDNDSIILQSNINNINLIKYSSSNYSFILLGHLYGSPSVSSTFPASNILGNINKMSSNNKFIILLGDIYRKPDFIHVQNFKKSFSDKLTIPVFNAIGNHEARNLNNYKTNFPGETYYNFNMNSELFIIIDSEMDPGKISGEQLEWFIKTLNAAANKEYKNIFIFSHKLIWASNLNKYDIVFKNLNSPAGYAKSDNFKEKILPLLKKISENKKIFWISGDIGAHKNDRTLPVFFENDIDLGICFIATGIGDNENDLLVQVEVQKDKDIKFKAIGLSKFENFGRLENFGLEHWNSKFSKKSKIKTKTLRILKNKYYHFGLFSGTLFISFFLIILKLKPNNYFQEQ
jgi:hypothetical protein